MKKNYLYRSYRSMLLASVMLMALPIQAFAQSGSEAIKKSDSYYFNINSGTTLAQALREIAITSGRTLKYDADDVAGYRVKEFKGTFATDQIVQAVISDTKLTMLVSTDGSIEIFQPDIVIIAKQSEAEKGFTKSRADSSTRMDVDLQQLPQSIQVITSKAIESQQLVSINDVLQNVSGVVLREGAQGTSSFSVRGFSQSSVLTNGASNPSANYANIASVDSIEVLKGPQAILSGGDSLGGGVNIVTKKPTAEKIRDVTLQYGSYEDKTASVDFSGPFSNKKFTYRITGSKSDAKENDAGFNGREAEYIQGQLRYKDNKADIILSLSKDEQHLPPNRYTFAITGKMQPVPSIRLGSVDDGIDISSKSASYQFKYKFTPWATFISNVNAVSTQTELNLYTPIFPLSSSTIAYMNTSSINNSVTLSGDHYVRFDFNVGSVEQKLSVGVNHSNIKTTSTGYSNSLYFVSIYGSQFDYPELTYNPSSIFTLSSYKSKQYAPFIQSYSTWGKVHLLLNLRSTYNKSEKGTTYYPTYNWTSTTPAHDEHKVTGGGGIVYDANSQLSFYGSYSQGYLPQYTTTARCDGSKEAYPPMETANSEVGAKYKTKDGRFSLTTSAFQLNQKNVLQYSSSGCFDIREAQKVKGFEIDGSGEPIDGLNLLFNYTLSDTEDTGNVSSSSKLPALAPRHQASLWASYKFQNPSLSGFGVSGGVTASSSSKFGTAGAYTLPSYEKIDLSVFYERKSLKVTLGVKNLLDETIYGYTSSQLYVPVLAGRTAVLTIKKGF